MKHKHPVASYPLIFLDTRNFSQAVSFTHSAFFFSFFLIYQLFMNGLSGEAFSDTLPIIFYEEAQVLMMGISKS